MAHGGDLQKIALGMQMGTIDPTVGALAATLKKYMMAEAQTAQAPTQTVAQQLFNPLAPPASMGGIGPPPGAPPMGAPPMGGMPPGAPPMGDMPMGAPPMGAPPAPPMGDMPMGDMPMGMADGGLAALPVPDNMFDEPMDGSYADGGIVSFRTGSPGTLSAAPDNLFGYSSDPMALVEEHRKLYQPKTEASERAKKLYNESLSEEGQEKLRKQGLNAFLMDFGAALTSETGPLLSAAGKAARKTLPGYQENVKERRAEQREAIKQLALDEGASNAEARREADLYMQGKGRYAELAQTDKKDREDRAFQREKLNIESDLTRQQIAATRAAAAGRDKPDPVMLYAQSIYQNAKLINDRLPLAKSMGEYRANPNAYRKDDSYLRQKAYEKALGARYFDPATNPVNVQKAGSMAIVNSGRSGAGQDTVDLGPIYPPQG